MNPALRLVTALTFGLLSSDPEPQQINRRIRIKGDKKAAKRLRKLREKSRKRNRLAA